jgi:hypothetical protein
MSFATLTRVLATAGWIALTALPQEHFDVATEPNGWRFILLTTQIDDPEYLTSMFLLNTPFRLLPDSTGWNPGPCTLR